VASKRPVTKKKPQDITGNRPAPLQANKIRKSRPSLALVGASHEQPVTFDPRLFLTKLGPGRTSREYEPGDAVFSQGDDADSVFYVETGKVKLTVVSKRGK
jgi:CRP-like cAMP-binding protein